MRLADSNEDMEGSFDNDVLIGDGGKNAMLGQPGEDRIYGNGGDDVLDARDGVRDAAVQCARPARRSSKASTSAPGACGAKGHAFVDSFDPRPVGCGETTHGTPVKGLRQDPGPRARPLAGRGGRATTSRLWPWSEAPSADEAAAIAAAVERFVAETTPAAGAEPVTGRRGSGRRCSRASAPSDTIQDLEGGMR